MTTDMFPFLILALAAGQVVTAVPQNPSADARYLLYLHGKAVEDGGRRPTTQFGRYEYDEILHTLAERGFTVISEARPIHTVPSEYAHTVVHQIHALMRRGVPPEHITIVGASKGAVIAMWVSSYLQHPRVGFALMGNCNSAT